MFKDYKNLEINWLLFDTSLFNFIDEKAKDVLHWTAQNSPCKKMNSLTKLIDKNRLRKWR